MTDDFVISDCLKTQIIAWFNDSSQSLFMICGNSGSGKTTLGRKIIPKWIPCNLLYISQFHLKKKTEIQMYLKQRLSNMDIAALCKNCQPKKNLVVFDDTHTIMTSSDKSWFMNYIAELRIIKNAKIMLLSKQISNRNLHILRKDITLIEIPNLTSETTIQITKNYVKKYNISIQSDALHLLVDHYDNNMALIISSLSCLKNNRLNTLAGIRKLTQNVHCNYTATGLTTMIEKIFACESLDKLRKFHDEDRGMMGLMFHENMLAKIRNKNITKNEKYQLYQTCLTSLSLGENYDKIITSYERPELLDYSIIIKLYYPCLYLNSYKSKVSIEYEKMTFTSILTKSAGALINIGVMNYFKKKFMLTNHRYSLLISIIIENIVRNPRTHQILYILDMNLQDIEKAVSLHNKFSSRKEIKGNFLSKQQIDKIFANRKN